MSKKIFGFYDGPVKAWEDSSASDSSDDDDDDNLDSPAPKKSTDSKIETTNKDKSTILIDSDSDDDEEAKIREMDARKKAAEEKISQLLGEIDTTTTNSSSSSSSSKSNNNNGNTNTASTSRRGRPIKAAKTNNSDSVVNLNSDEDNNNTVDNDPKNSDDDDEFLKDHHLSAKLKQLEELRMKADAELNSSASSVPTSRRNIKRKAIELTAVRTSAEREHDEKNFFSQYLKQFDNIAPVEIDKVNSDNNTISGQSSSAIAIDVSSSDTNTNSNFGSSTADVSNNDMGNNVNIKTRLNGKHEWRWNIKKDDKLKKLRDKYCEIYSVTLNQVSIEFDGVAIGDNDTPEGLDMEDDDLIDCSIHKDLYNVSVASAEAVKSGKTVPPPPSPVHMNGINIKTRLNGKHEWRWNIKKDDKLKKLRDKYCEIYSVTLNQVSIEFDGVAIGDNDTPEGLDMEDDDLIDCSIHKDLYNGAIVAAEEFKSGKRKLTPVGSAVPPPIQNAVSSNKSKTTTSRGIPPGPTPSSASSSNAPRPTQETNIDPNDTCHLKIEFIFGSNPQVFEVKIKNEFVLSTVLERVLQSPNLKGKFINNQLVPSDNCCIWLGSSVISNINQSVTSLKQHQPYFSGQVYVIPTSTMNTKIPELLGFGTKVPVLLVDHGSSHRIGVCFINPKAKTLSALFSQAKIQLSVSHPRGFNLFNTSDPTRPLRQSFTIMGNFTSKMPVIIVKHK